MPEALHRVTSVCIPVSLLGPCNPPVWSQQGVWSLQKHWQYHIIVESAVRPDGVRLHCRGLLGSGDVTHFQYDVAEVKLSVRERPEWLESLTASGQLTAELYANSVQCDHAFRPQL